MLKVALVGAMGHGQIHLNTLARMEEAGSLRLVSVVEPNLVPGSEVHARLKGKGVRILKSLEELFQTSAPEAVVLSTPIALHAEMVEMCLESGCQRILVEKPAVPLLGQLDDLINADQGSKVRVGFQMLFWPSLLQLKRGLIERRLGEPHFVRVSAGWPRMESYYRRNGWAGRMAVDGKPVFDGPATNALAHLIQNVAFLLGEELEGFAAPSRVSGCLMRARPIESYDTAMIAADFRGIQADFFFTHACEELHPFRVVVQCDAGRFELSETPPHFSAFSSETDDRIEIEDAPASGFDNSAMYEEFSSPLNHFQRMRSKLVDSRPFTLITNGAFHSSQGIHSFSRRALDGKTSWPALCRAREAMQVFLASPERARVILDMTLGKFLSASDIPPSLTHNHAY